MAKPKSKKVLVTGLMAVPALSREATEVLVNCFTNDACGMAADILSGAQGDNLPKEEFVREAVGFLDVLCQRVGVDGNWMMSEVSEFLPQDKPKPTVRPKVADAVIAALAEAVLLRGDEDLNDDELGELKSFAQALGVGLGIDPKNYNGLN
jgi:hypothetical protein